MTSFGSCRRDIHPLLTTPWWSGLIESLSQVRSAVLRPLGFVGGNGSPSLPEASPANASADLIGILQAVPEGRMSWGAPTSPPELDTPDRADRAGFPLIAFSSTS